MDKYSDLLNAYDRRTIVGIDWSHENHQPGSVLSWYTVSMQKNTHTQSDSIIVLLNNSYRFIPYQFCCMCKMQISCDQK